MQTLSVVIPAHNEAQNLPAVLSEIISACAGLPGLGPQIVVVDDHSSDGTFAQMQALGGAVECYRLSRRSGSHVALRAGLAAARGEAVICLAADGQDDPQVFGQMLNLWQEGAQVVWALARERPEEPRLQGWAARAFYGLLLGSMAGQLPAHIDYARASFYLLDRAVVEAVKACPERNTSLFGLIAWLGFDQQAVEYSRRPRRAGASKWNFKSRLRLAKDWLLAFSELPLKILTWLALGVLSAGLALLAGLGLAALLGASPAGWAWGLAAFLGLGGIQLLGLTILAEYLWRGLDEARRRPLYFIERRLGPGPEAPADTREAP